jgi:co-chaperonin GroES (HSP10)
MRVVAVGHRLVIKPYSIEENDPIFAAAKRAGISLLDQDQRREQVAVDKGTVLEIGPSAFTALNPPGADTPWCKVGDVIGYTRNAGKYIKIDEQTHVLVINDEDVVNIFKED